MRRSRLSQVRSKTREENYRTSLADWRVFHELLLCSSSSTSLSPSEPVHHSSLPVNAPQPKTIKSASHRSFQIIFFSDLAAGDESERVLHHVLHLTKLQDGPQQRLLANSV